MLKKMFEEHSETFMAVVDGEIIEVLITFKEDYFEASMRVKGYGIYDSLFGAPRYQNQEYKTHDDIVEWVYNYIVNNNAVEYYLDEFGDECDL